MVGNRDCYESPLAQGSTISLESNISVHVIGVVHANILKARVLGVCFQVRGLVQRHLEHSSEAPGGSNLTS